MFNGKVLDKGYNQVDNPYTYCVEGNDRSSTGPQPLTTGSVQKMSLRLCGSVYCIFYDETYFVVFYKIKHSNLKSSSGIMKQLLPSNEVNIGFTIFHVHTSYEDNHFSVLCNFS